MAKRGNWLTIDARIVHDGDGYGPGVVQVPSGVVAALLATGCARESTPEEIDAQAQAEAQAKADAEAAAQAQAEADALAKRSAVEIAKANADAAQAAADAARSEYQELSKDKT